MIGLAGTAVLIGAGGEATVSRWIGGISQATWALPVACLPIVGGTVVASRPLHRHEPGALQAKQRPGVDREPHPQQL